LVAAIPLRPALSSKLSLIGEQREDHDFGSARDPIIAAAIQHTLTARVMLLA
jgi:hypothetical protein